MLSNAAEQPKILQSVKNEEGNHYLYFLRSLKQTLCFRSLNLSTDLEHLHRWVQHPKAKEFWQLPLSKHELQTHYTYLLQNPYTHSLIGVLDGQPFCQIDLYTVAIDELANHIPHLRPTDIGLHFMMAPTTHPISGLSRIALQHFLRYYQRIAGSNRLWGEPDVRNQKAIQLIQRCGFAPLHPIQLSYKTALLHCFRERDTNLQ